MSFVFFVVFSSLPHSCFASEQCISCFVVFRLLFFSPFAVRSHLAVLQDVLLHPYSSSECLVQVSNKIPEV